MSKSSKNKTGVNGIEKRVILTALLVSCLGMGLIAYSTWGMGITIADCVPNSKIFERGSVKKLAEKNYEIHFLASMWAFEPSRVTVPAGSSLDLFVISKDVTHGFNIIGTNVNMMVEPAVVNEARVHFEHPGTYTIVCHEYCGVGHQAMNAVIEVSDSAQDISADGLPASESSASANTLPGKAIMDQKGCLACHSVDGTVSVGPSFKGLWGTKAELTDGTSPTVDAAYVKDMIESPGKKVVKGFPPVMPKLPVSDEEFGQIIEYLKALR
ncbi:MAG TPA: c-type cytochrome [Candidatus Acidoferrales bacterium]|jgi:cytochrome c oxidase subunit 2|nr:c-type cytochrome [Candidatus Acidoferrales bacterium]